VAVPAVIVSQPVVRIENFLDPAQVAALLDWAVGMRAKFAPSTVTTGVENYRRSQVIHDLAEARPEMETMIHRGQPTSLRLTNGRGGPGVLRASCGTSDPQFDRVLPQ